jgi:hypothetical protein
MGFVARWITQKTNVGRHVGECGEGPDQVYARRDVSGGHAAADGGGAAARF